MERLSIGRGVRTEPIGESPLHLQMMRHPQLWEARTFDSQTSVSGGQSADTICEVGGEKKRVATISKQTRTCMFEGM
jgi:hypothetical protein